MNSSSQVVHADKIRRYMDGAFSLYRIYMLVESLAT